MNLQSVHASIGIVPQDTVLFNESIKYNIRYGAPHCTDSEFLQAVKQANLHGFIESLPEKYDTVVGERGLKLSGGEKQRVSIARTILKDPPILVLDEATSSLDSKSEKLIQAALEVVAENRTTLVIAHRLSTIADADMILVLDDGEIVEKGTHSELLELNGLFAEMWWLQQVEETEAKLTQLAEKYSSREKLSFSAIIFDLDGLLIDTETVSKQAWMEGAADFGFEFTESLYAQIAGTSVKFAKARIADSVPAINVDAYVEHSSNLYYQSLEKNGIEVMAGVAGPPGISRSEFNSDGSSNIICESERTAETSKIGLVRLL